MTEITISLKTFGPLSARCLAAFQRTLNWLTLGLEAEARIHGQTDRGWIRVEVHGDDELVVINQLRQMYGVTPVGLDVLRPSFTHAGSAVDVGKIGYGVYVDLGISSPRIVDALVPLRVLRAQLADGEKVSTRRITETYGIVDHVSLSIRLVRVDVEARRIEAEFSENQVAHFEEWASDRLDRVLAMGIPPEDADEALRRSGLSRDVIGIQSQGPFEHQFVCKMGTDAAGVLSKLGKYLPGVPLHVVSPYRSWLRKRSSSNAP